jgi:predicted exporter
MNRFLISAIAATLMAGAAVPAMAQGSRPVDWQPLSSRAADVASRIQAGVATGSLSDETADQLRGQFKALMNLEDDYRKTGLTLNQREDLQARYDTLVARISVNSAHARLTPDGSIVRSAGAAVVVRETEEAPGDVVVVRKTEVSPAPDR